MRSPVLPPDANEDVHTVMHKDGASRRSKLLLVKLPKVLSSERRVHGRICGCR